MFHIVEIFRPSEFVSRTKLSICQQIEGPTKGFQSVETKPIVVEDWKKNKEKDVITQIEDQESELYAVEAQLEEMNRPILEPPH